ncbi:MAG: hypothetical protein HYY95_08315 [Candidatus Rokubacteria bacterium]|nr:hypothetical protein [Candidatus Rokubacteria bacterium]
MGIVVARGPRVILHRRGLAVSWQAVVETAVAPGSGPPVLGVGGSVSVVGRSLLLLRARLGRE